MEYLDQLMKFSAQKSVNMSKVREIWPEILDYGLDIDEQIEINSHYRGYLKKQKADILAFKRDENLIIIILIMINFQAFLTK